MLPYSISSLPSPGQRGMGARDLSGAFWDQKEEALLQEEQPQFPQVNKNKQFPLGPEEESALRPRCVGGGAAQAFCTPCPTGLQQRGCGLCCFVKLMSFGSPKGEQNLSAGLSQAETETPWCRT